MTDAQRITLMADWWPRACQSQDWDEHDRELRLKVLGEAVGRPLKSASELNNREDIDRVKAHLGLLSGNLKAAVETIKPDLGRARRLRKVIGDQLKCVALYHPDAEHFLAAIIRDKFQYGGRSALTEALTIEDLTAEGLPGRSQLDQVVMTLARNINAMRNQAGDTIHDMKSRAGLECSCRKCAQKAVHAFAGAHEDETGFEKGPF